MAICDAPYVPSYGRCPTWTKIALSQQTALDPPAALEHHLLLLARWRHSHRRSRFGMRPSSHRASSAAGRQHVNRHSDRLLLMPTTRIKATKLPAVDASREEIVERALNMISNTAPFDLTHHPCDGNSLRAVGWVAGVDDVDRPEFGRAHDLSCRAQFRAMRRLEVDGASGFRDPDRAACQKFTRSAPFSTRISRASSGVAMPRPKPSMI